MQLLTSSISGTLPPDLFLAMGDVSEVSGADTLPVDKREEFSNPARQRRTLQFTSSRKLMANLSEQAGLDPGRLSLLKDKLGKPFGVYGEEQVHLSISHSTPKVLCALSLSCPVGVDLEPSTRSVQKKLMDRILHPEENWIEQKDLIRIWTMKEALVKLQGRGLRTNLNEVAIRPERDNEFSGRFNDDKTARICSFQHRDYWIAVAIYSNLKQTAP